MRSEIFKQALFSKKKNKNKQTKQHTLPCESGILSCICSLFTCTSTEIYLRNYDSPSYNLYQNHEIRLKKIKLLLGKKVWFVIQIQIKCCYFYTTLFIYTEVVVRSAVTIY